MDDLGVALFLETPLKKVTLASPFCGTWYFEGIIGPWPQDRQPIFFT